jgi:probable addiction module antidote protein
MAKTKDYEKDLLKRLKNAEYAAGYLNAILEDNEDRKGLEERFLMALRDIATAHGVSSVSKSSKLNRQSLYRILSKGGNPELATLTSLLKSMGLRLAVEVQKKAS